MELMNAVPRKKCYYSEASNWSMVGIWGCFMDWGGLRKKFEQFLLFKNYINERWLEKRKCGQK